MADEQNKPIKEISLSEAELKQIIDNLKWPQSEELTQIINDFEQSQRKQQEEIEKAIAARFDDLAKQEQELSKRLTVWPIELNTFLSVIPDAIKQLKLIQLQALLNRIDIELKKPAYNNLSMLEVIHRSIDKNGHIIPGSLWENVINVIIPQVSVIKTEKIDYPLDKVNSTIWELLESDTKGQVTIAAEKAGSKKEINILYSIDFDALDSIDFDALEDGSIKMTKKLTAFDKRVYIAVGGLYNAGNTIITVTQVHYAMGNITRPKENQLKKINNSITKMAKAWVYINNEQEANTYNYRKFIYDGSLLPMERESAIINGKFVDAAIHIFREPPILYFARQRNQITTIPVKLLQSPISKTDDNLQLEDYLIERIAHAKNGTGKPKILYRTLYEHAGIATKKQKQRAPEKIKRYLDYYKEQNYINNYSVGKDGLTVFFDKPKEITQEEQKELNKIIDSRVEKKLDEYYS